MFSTKNLQLWQKFVVAAVLAVMMFSAPMSVLISRSNEAAKVAEREKLGEQYARSTIKLVQLIQQHRGLSSLVLSGNKASIPKWEAKRDQINQQIRQIDDVDNRLATLGLSNAWKAVRAEWEKLATSVAGLTPTESMTRHAGLVEKIFRFNRTLTDESGLSLDPEKDTYYLMLSGINRVPQLTETLGKLRAYGSAALLNKSMLQENRVIIRIAADDAAKSLALIEENLDKAALNAALKAGTQTLLANTRAVLDYSNEKIVQDETPDISSEDYFEKLTTVINAQFAFAEQLNDVLIIKLDERIHELRTREYGMVSAIMVLFVLFILYGLVVMRSILQPLEAISKAMRMLEKGDMPPLDKADYGPEFNHLRNGLNATTTAVQALIADVKLLAGSAIEGKLTTRANANQHQGDYRKVIEGVNETLNAVVGPLDVAADYINKIAHGDIPPKITANYYGDFNHIKNNLNLAIGAVNALLQDTNTLAQAAVEGRLETRADAGRHNGDFRKIIEGVNSTLDVVVGSVKDVMLVLAAMERGDLTHKMSKNYAGMFGLLKNDLNKTIEKLTSIIRRIHESAESIHVATSEIAMGNNDLSGRTEEQAASLEETAASMQELTGTVKQNAESALQANQLALGASDVAVKGGAIVKRAVDTMHEISTSSKKIADIIGIIDGLAFQTNILALNAAVEAARAGEQGRGFAVVASEVRSLAQRSATAAREIKALIDDSVQKVESGAQLVDDAGTTMDEIVTSIKRVTDIMGEITAASREQSTGIEQVNQTIAHMDEATQQNSALVEQAAAAAESLDEQSNALAEAVRAFRLAKAA